MGEISDNAMIFITTSFQALEIAKANNIYFAFPSCIVSLAFAGFYIEENLDVIIRAMGKEKDMKDYYNPPKKNKLRRNKDHGLLEKMAWFYNAYIARQEVEREKIFDKDMNGKLIILKKIERKFPGFKKIYECRNDIAHGKINHFIRISDADRLRSESKKITDELIKIANSKGIQISKNIPYEDAVSHFIKTHPAI